MNKTAAVEWLRKVYHDLTIFKDDVVGVPKKSY